MRSSDSGSARRQDRADLALMLRVVIDGQLACVSGRKTRSLLERSEQSRVIADGPLRRVKQRHGRRCLGVLVIEGLPVEFFARDPLGEMVGLVPVPETDMRDDLS